MACGPKQAFFFYLVRRTWDRLLATFLGIKDRQRAAFWAQSPATQSEAYSSARFHCGLGASRSARHLLAILSASLDCHGGGNLVRQSAKLNCLWYGRSRLRPVKQTYDT